MLMLASCSNSRKIAYFNNQQDTTLASVTVPEAIIQKNDLLGITVSSLNPQASAIFNTSQVSYNTTSTEAGTVMQPTGYLVDQQGRIQFPVLGDLKASGLTANQLSQEIKRVLIQRKLLVDPIVNIRFLNFKVTVLGEVAHPTVINVPNEKITLLEALGLAGDLTIYGRRDNVMLIREQEGKKTIRRLNLNSSDLFSSPYYHLQSNDVVYVEPNKAKISSATKTTQVLPIILSGLSFAAIIIDRMAR
ncbi:MAG TPA: polysaccharide biosynthesis/export family protein [Chitinophagaceae bacterium]|nr:polysaccharide biosynthesis/export family protein [Chitinophagaceae bacterium]